MQNLLVTAIDNLGQSATTTVPFTGLTSLVGQFNSMNSIDVTSWTEIHFSSTTFHRQRNELFTAMRLSNRGIAPLDATLAAQFDAIEPATISVVLPNAMSDTGQPQMLFDSELPSSGLQPAQTSNSINMHFANSTRNKYATEISILAARQSYPLVSLPNRSCRPQPIAPTSIALKHSIPMAVDWASRCFRHY